MKTSAYKYSKFAFNTVFKKKSSIIIPTLTFIVSFIIGFVFKFAINEKYLPLSSHLYIFAILITTVLFASIKSLNIFKDFEEEGLELVGLSKPISRNNFVFGKLLTLIYFGLIWSSILFISALLSTYALYSSVNLFVYSLLFFVVGLATYLLIGLITSLISYKLSQKISITLPLVFFIPLALGGSLLSANATTNVNNAAYYINKKYPYHFSGNEVNVEPYFINNNKDELLLMPNGYENKKFTQEQIDYLKEVMNIANKSSSEWQVYSWLSVPYQLLDIFNFKDQNVFESISKNSFSNQDNYVYYNNLDSILFKYKLDENVNQKKFSVTDKSRNSEKYIVPGLLKSNSVIPNSVNTDIIYAREDASSVNVSFPEDNSEFSAENNLVGKLKWKYVFEVLQDSAFNFIAREFVEKFKSEMNQNKEIIDPVQLKWKLLDRLSEFINNNESQINQYSNSNLVLFDEHAVKDKKLQSEIERKIYFATAILNFIYFNYQNSDIFEAVIVDQEKPDSFGDNRIELRIAGFKYLIGGYEGFEKKLFVKENKVLIRYDLIDSKTNYLFQSQDQLFAINREKQIVNKNVYFVLWLIIIGGLFASVFVLYKRKEFK
ncbi:ABC transporter permease [Mycoplasma sp. CSL7503-lung]|uniref:ABC transporter permease n=1 Tax=Mycoplasma sp. CSL7503-lung TaxID=536372 RepID=UPI0021D20646|nr:ABC transporter permease [Mycoplasma sp. CSL7503-lung]MCU4706622.1 ABC transporter permease [Mycoplasma sp. CSL7503-lung]